MLALISTLLRVLVSGLQPRSQLLLENMALRHQLMMLRRSAPKPRLKKADRFVWMLLQGCWSGWQRALLIVVGRSTIAKVLKEVGLDPAPERQKQTTWKEFLRSHFAVLAAADFFSVEVWTAAGLVRYHVFFVIRLATREVQIAGIIPEPHGEWMEQVARNLTDGLGGFLVGCRHLLHDRSSLFTQEFEMILDSVGIKTVRLPARSPNLNAYAERYVRTIREGCLDRIILIGEGSLRRALGEFVVHYHTEKNHQGLGNKILKPEFPEFPRAGEVLCRERLGGMLHYYYQAAA